MKIETIRDFQRPRAQVLHMFRDPARIETVLQEMGARVERVSVAPQMAWSCAMVWREEPRKFSVNLLETSTDETMTMTLESDLAGADMVMDFYDLDDGGCRIIVEAELSAHTMVARLALQSLRLVRGKAEDRLKRFVGALGGPPRK
ncbi:hypothetical protein [Pararhodobacter sp.]|uniref:hypothetical protein n=1 Tax=Pararhodobacter sp. TaxID=2127056 RepID=UPI002AFDF3D4|nr:hypothetical protein [Pararhodobacter sp.]